ncbi:hypothetical protein K432DRAFT_396033 [Lepidopterella palustris CBS 459.81]|uniref:Uncharacterized protein n=1 Tax=Lepidopterella palustris CBS 459.81 TaxID=1314670 RepID=A0A8E2JC26_9PEZI|nr:hypothetical protein K432DRAFT_396033 [Lepidopterella palustris CBS 459.81]
MIPFGSALRKLKVHAMRQKGTSMQVMPPIRGHDRAHGCFDFNDVAVVTRVTNHSAQSFLRRPMEHFIYVSKVPSLYGRDFAGNSNPSENITLRVQSPWQMSEIMDILYIQRSVSVGKQQDGGSAMKETGWGNRAFRLLPAFTAQINAEKYVHMSPRAIELQQFRDLVWLF